MSGDLTQALRTAHSGLLTSQQALDAVARNVANVNTPGYSRKIVNLEQRTLAGTGAGVDFGELTRRVDQGLLDSLRQETGGLHASNIRKDMLDRIQALFGTPESDSSLSHALTDFQTAVESLAAAPQDGLGQRDVVRAGADATSLLRRYSNGIQDLRAEADQQIGKTIEEIDGLLTKVADLNDKIVRNQAIGQSVADLQDSRDQAVDRLSQLIDIRAVGRSNGAIVVFTAGGRTLVDGTATKLSHIAATGADASVTYAKGDFDGIYVGDRTAGNDITGDIRSGELSGLIEMRDKVLPDLQGSLDALATELRDTVNAVHNRGTGFPDSFRWREAGSSPTPRRRRSPSAGRRIRPWFCSTPTVRKYGTRRSGSCSAARPDRSRSKATPAHRRSTVSTKRSTRGSAPTEPLKSRTAGSPSPSKAPA